MDFALTSASKICHGQFLEKKVPFARKYLFTNYLQLAPGNTTIGLLPPSSSVVRFRFDMPAAFIIALPTY